MIMIIVTVLLYYHYELLFSLPGFSRLRMHTKCTSQGHSIPVAFVEFKDIGSAGSAMAALQGTFLLSSDRGAIRIEYAKSKMIADAHQALREVCYCSLYY